MLFPPPYKCPSAVPKKVQNFELVLNQFGSVDAIIILFARVGSLFRKSMKRITLGSVEQIRIA